MTITNNVAAKFAVAFVAVAMMFSAVAPVANAQNVSEMSLDQLIALVTQLQSQLGQGDTTTIAGSCETIMAPLTIGAEGVAVMALQNRLIAAGQVIPAGATGYFGGQTQAALAAWQAANGVSPAVGYYGPITKAAMDAACVPATEEEDEDEDDDNGSVTLSGEASLEVFEMDSADEDQIEEGAEDAAIAEATVEFSNGDAEISRMDVELVGSGNEQDPWDTFDEVSLWVDGDEVAKMSADSKSDYLGDEDDGILRFSGLDLVAMEDEEMVITIAATVSNSVDLGGNSDAWTVAVENMRFFDADGVATTEKAPDFDFGATQSFSIEEAGFEDEILVKTSSSDPDGTTLQVEDNSKSDWYTVFVFDLDTDDSINDIMVNGVEVDVQLGSTTVAYNTFVDDAELVIDGTTIDSSSGDVSNGTSDIATIAFDVDGDVVIDAGDRVKAELRLKFKALSVAGNEGMTVRATVAGADVDAEGADDFAGTGAATGEYHTLRTTGIEVELDSTSATVTSSDGALNDYATFVISLDVTAFNQEVFIPISSASTSWSLLNSSGGNLNPETASTSVVMTSTADEGGAGDAFFEINEGSTETVTLTVTYTPSLASTAARLQLNSLVFDETGTVTGSDDSTWTATPASTYRTDVKTIVN